MRNMLVSLSVVAALAASAPALAEESSGRVQAVNSWSITLQDGTFYTFTDSSKIKDLKPGDEVSVTYVETPDENVGVVVKRR